MLVLVPWLHNPDCLPTFFHGVGVDFPQNLGKSGNNFH